MTDAVRVEGLVKTYAGTQVLDGVDLAVAPGGIFALLGPNGAGKTTMVRILSTLVRHDAGRVTVAGFDVVRERAKVRRAISLTGQDVSLDELQTGEENLRMLAALRGLSRGDAARRTAELLDLFDLTEAAHRRVGTYSGGQRRRLDIAASVVGRPAVAFLDEPTTGLDPRSRLGMWDLVRGLAEDGGTVFLTTQYLEEADQLADRIVVLDRGRVVADGTSSSLKQRYASVRLDLIAAGRPEYARLAATLSDRIVHSEPSRHLHGVATDGTAAHVRHLLDIADPDRTDVVRFEVHTATLDDVFLALTGSTTTELDKETINV